ncbi:MAG TPA: hypothetical protein VN369_02090, partial [Terriglobales bacterium]|nr:hypothetical protein [Terriglobales bacterium]
LKQTAPEEFSLFEDGEVAGLCRFTSEDGALVILDILEKKQIPGLDIYDALLRAVANFTLPLGFAKVLCKNPLMSRRLAALRFVRDKDDMAMVSTPEEVLREMCNHA